MKAGLEIHQQLATGKLFCDCPTDLTDTVSGSVVRRLRATGGENHLVDRAAAFQAARELAFRYEAGPSSCLVELDEEPPHPLNAEALDLALIVALLLDARPLDEVVVMRKIVVDGSNTAGFQRTALVAVDGQLTVGGKRVSIASVCLEEDAARKVGEVDHEVRYRLDRLGIPLIEIATGPEITSGAEAREVAAEIGALLRATQRVRRGIGTIREDLNVSISGGARVELKGIQELRLLPRYAESEEARQRTLLAVRDQLVARGARVPDRRRVDVTALIPGAGGGALSDIVRRGGTVRALALPGFAGLLRSPEGETERLGRELADYARAAGVRGLFHSDEVPLGPLDAAFAARVRSELALGEADAFVLVGARDGAVAERALELVRERAAMALEGIPHETRDPLPDGRSRYSRPLPGRDRMYPETDVPPGPVRPAHLERLRAGLPERPEVARARIARQHRLPEPIVRQLQQAGDLEAFEALAARGRSATGIARLLTQDHPAAAAGEAGTIELPLETLDAVLAAVEAGRFAKEGIPPVLAQLLQGAHDLPEAVSRAGLASAGAPADLDTLAESVVARNEAMVRERGAEAFSPLMGDLMREVRGRRDGKEVAAALRRALDRHRAPTGPAT